MRSKGSGEGKSLAGTCLLWIKYKTQSAHKTITITIDAPITTPNHISTWLKPEVGSGSVKFSDSAERSSSDAEIGSTLMFKLRLRSRRIDVDKVVMADVGSAVVRKS